MKANSALGGGKAPQTTTQSPISKAVKPKGSSEPKATPPNEKIEISAEAKAKAEELAKENKLLKAKLKDSRVSEGNKALQVRSLNQPKLMKKPGVFFIGGLSLGGLTESKGITAMGEHIPQAERYHWNQEEAVLSQIKRRPASEAIVLVGHGLGGDTAVNIANKLNSLEYGYRKVDLLVTMDSSGTNNDIIPQNVKENLNFIDSEGGLFKDGPNIARNEKLTKISNQLYKDTDGPMDEQSEIQFQIFEKINNILLDTKWERTESEFLAKVRGEDDVIDEKAIKKIDRLVSRDLNSNY